MADEKNYRVGIEIDATDTATPKVERARKSLDTFEKHVQKTRQTVEKPFSGAPYQKVTQGLNQASAAADKATKKLGTVRTFAARGASFVVKIAESGYSRVKRTLDGLKRFALGGLAVLGAAGGLAAPFFPIAKAMEFERIMRNVNSIAQGSEQEFKRWGDQVLNLTTKLPQSADDLARALYDINSSGFMGQKGLIVLEVAAKAASAGVSDTATSVNAITGALNAYGLSVDHAADVSDIYFKTVKDGVITFPQLSQGIGEVMATASAAGVQLGEIGAAIASMTKAGIPAAETMTALNGLLVKFLKPTKELDTALKAQGYQSGLTLLKTKGLAGGIQFLMKASHGNADAMADMLGDIRAMRAGMSLAREGGKDFAYELDQIADKANRAGSTNQALAEQSKGVGYQFDIAKNRVKKALIELGQLALPQVNKLLDSFSKLNFKGWIGEIKPTLVELGSAMRSAFEAAKPSLVWLTRKGIPDMLVALNLVIGAVGDTAKAMKDYEFLRTIITGITTSFILWRIQIALTGTALAVSAAKASLFGGIALGFQAAVAIFSNLRGAVFMLSLAFDAAIMKGGLLRASLSAPIAATAFNAILTVVSLIAMKLVEINAETERLRAQAASGEVRADSMTGMMSDRLGQAYQATGANRATVEAALRSNTRLRYDKLDPAGKTNAQIRYLKEHYPKVMSNMGSMTNRESTVANKYFPVPGHASGGLVTRPHLAMVGEQGPELILPLRKFFAGLSPAPAGAGGNMPPINVTINTSGPVDGDEIGRKVYQGVKKALQNMPS